MPKKEGEIVEGYVWLLSIQSEQVSPSNSFFLYTNFQDIFNLEGEKLYG